MKTKNSFVVMIAVALTLPITLMVACKSRLPSGAEAKGAPSRPQGPCDIYATGGTPCVAAHSTTRALYGSYNGPLYRIMRQSDGRSLDIGVVRPVASPVPDAGGYANAAAQDDFCANTYCWITTIYDQSPKHNDLTQAPRGGFSGPAMGGFNNVPLADMAPITIMGHKAYGVFIEPGMGLRQDNAKGTAVDDQAEGQYWVINGHHYNAGCCFDYGNAETDSRDDGNGTMETTYYGNSTGWYRGSGNGPWVMTDQENNLVGGVNADGSKFMTNLPSINWRFVTGMAKGEPHHWTSMGGDSQTGELAVMFSGPRVNNTYDPMRKQGAILLGNGGDNSNGSQGTFYEGAMTAGGTFPTDATDQLVQANVVAAKYDVPMLSLTPALATDTPPGIQTFAPGSSQDSAVTFKNTTGAPVTDVKLSIATPKRWAATATTSDTIPGPVAPGASVNATFTITSGAAPFNGDLVGQATWTTMGGKQSGTTVEKVRSVSPVKINEFAVNPTGSFIELYNAGASDVDLSGWSLTEHPTQQAIFSSVKIPAGTKLGTHGFYVLGLANSGLAIPASKGDTTIHVRSIAGMSVGDTIEIDTGSSVETRKIASLGTAAGNPTTLWQPLPDGPLLTIPTGSVNVPATSLEGFAVGDTIGIGYGATYPTVAKSVERYEVVKVTGVGKPGTQTYLAAEAKAGETTMRVRNAGNISAGDKITLDIDTMGHGIETVTVMRVGAAAGGGGRGGRGGGSALELAAPLKFNHSANDPFSVRGTGVSFQPATKVPHSSNEPLQPLGTGITLDRPLAAGHAINAVVRDAAATSAGYQGPPAPDQWFGGPALSPNAGSMVLRDAAGLVVDSLNYGGLVDPWAAQGYQAASGSAASGCSVPSPAAGGRGGFGGRGGGAAPIRSAGRFPDGADTGSNCRDFLLQAAITLAADADVGAKNIKVSSVADFETAQSIAIGTGGNRETAVIATVGTAGATTVATATEAGATDIFVARTVGFSAGQSITIDSGANLETAVVVSANLVSARGDRRGSQTGLSGGRITITAPLTLPHAAEAQVSGTGITLTAALTRAHENGVQVGGHGPTPGGPNQYSRRTQ